MGSDPAAVRLEVDGGLATIRLQREHGNAINDHLIDGLIDIVQEVQSDPAVRGALLAAAGKIFCPGLDLIELVTFDRPAMERFLGRFVSALMMLYAFPKPLVAALSGHALAGGSVLALTADRRILREGALVGLNEVQVGVPLPFAVALILRESVHSNYLDEVALMGRNYSGDQAIATGLVQEVLPAEGFEVRCRERLEEYASKDPRAFATTKRYLRAATLERVRAYERQFLGEFLDCWFDAATRSRLDAMVERLTGKGRS